MDGLKIDLGVFHQKEIFAGAVSADQKDGEKVARNKNKKIKVLTI